MTSKHKRDINIILTQKDVMAKSTWGQFPRAYPFK